LRVLLKIGPGLTNTGAVTLEMDGLGAVAIKDPLALDPVAGVITAGAYAEFVYNGTNWILLVPNISVWGNALLATRSMFSAGKTAPQAGFPVNVAAGIVFDSLAVQVHGDFASSTWTPPAGRVLLTGVLWTESTVTTIATFAIRRNSVTVIALINHTFASPLEGISFSGMDVANGTDTYTVWATFQSGGTVHAGSAFSGALL